VGSDRLPPPSPLAVDIGDVAVSLRAVANSDALALEEVKAEMAVGEWALTALENVPQLAAQIGVTAATGVAGSLLFMSAQIGGGQYLELTGEGVAKRTATVAALVSGLVQGWLERIGVGTILKTGTPAVRKIVNAAIM